MFELLSPSRLAFLSFAGRDSVAAMRELIGPGGPKPMGSKANDANKINAGEGPRSRLDCASLQDQRGMQHRDEFRRESFFIGSALGCPHQSSIGLALGCRARVPARAGLRPHRGHYRHQQCAVEGARRHALTACFMLRDMRPQSRFWARRRWCFALHCRRPVIAGRSGWWASRCSCWDSMCWGHFSGSTLRRTVTPARARALRY